MHPQADSKLIQGDENGRPLNPQNVSSFRRYLPQVSNKNNNNEINHFFNLKKNI